MDDVAVIPEPRAAAHARQLGSKYVLGAPLGRGAMGVVHEATNTQNEPLAIKVLRPELASDERTVARFVQERQIFSRLNHPNVVHVHDLVAEGDLLGIVMERVNGGDLKDRIGERSLTPTQSMRIATEIAAGLEAIHAVNVVHRDLKPANILIAELPDGSLQPKISDFGISRLVSDAMTGTSTTIGTPLYMAPEAADKRGAHSPADVYSLGALMFELLIGSAPFNEGGTFAVLKAHAVERPPAVGGVPAALAALIDEMLAKEPEARPTATAVRQRLVAILPHIDDEQTPIAIPRPSSDDTLQAKWAAVAAADDARSSSSSASNSVSTSGGTSASGDLVAVGHPETGQDGTTTGEPSDDRAKVGTLAAAAAVAAAAPAVPAPPVDPAIGSFQVPAGWAEPTAGAPVAEVDVTGPPAGPTPEHGPGQGLVLNQVDPSQSPGFHVEPPSPPTADARTGWLFPARKPKQLIGLGIAVASLSILSGIGLATLTGDSSSDDAGPGDGSAIEAGDGTSDDEGGLGSDGRAAGVEGGQGRFSSTAQGGASDGESGEQLTGSEGQAGSGSQGQAGAGAGAGGATGTTSAGGTSPTTEGEPTATTEGPGTTIDSPITTEAEVTTTTLPTTTERETTTTEQDTTTSEQTTTTVGTTTTIAPVAEPIRIVSGPTVNVVNSTSFQFNYTTNDVCGTGSFRVFEASSGTLIGSNVGQNVCFGPLHGGYPQASHPTFGGYNLEPSTTYRVVVTVRGTASDGIRTAGSGTDSRTFNVTTSP